LSDIGRAVVYIFSLSTKLVLAEPTVLVCNNYSIMNNNVLEKIEQLFQLTHKNLNSLVRKARALGLEPARFDRQGA